MSVGIWVIHTGAKSGGESVTLFDSYSYDVSVLVYESYIQVPNLGVRWWRFLTVTLMMVSVQVYGSYMGVANLGVAGDAFWRLLL